MKSMQRGRAREGRGPDDGCLIRLAYSSSRANASGQSRSAVANTSPTVFQQRGERALVRGEPIVKGLHALRPHGRYALNARAENRELGGFSTDTGRVNNTMLQRSGRRFSTSDKFNSCRMFFQTSFISGGWAAAPLPTKRPKL